MNRIPKVMNRRSGSTLVVVMMLTALGTLAAGSVAFCIGSRVQQTYKQVFLEQAFYLAEAGAERAASDVAGGNESTKTLTGTLGGGSYVTDIQCTLVTGGEVQIDVVSVGTVKNVSRTITMHGLRSVSWARYALWYDSQSVALSIAAGDSFRGRFYAKPQLSFLGASHFYDKAWTGAASYTSSGDAPIFDFGLVVNAPVETMASVDFAALQAAAGLVLEGPTTITINNATLSITNARKGWTTPTSQPIPAGGVVYVKNYTSGTTTTLGDITVSGPNGLGGRLTLVSENTIKVVDNIVYKNNPTNNPSSTDALGLIAKQDVAVQTTAPKNLQIYAHLMCVNGGYTVIDYDKTVASGNRGTMTVYGGIVNLIRKPVATSSDGYKTWTGYMKNYVFDTRFSLNPPPSYPRLVDELEWTAWEG